MEKDEGEDDPEIHAKVMRAQAAMKRMRLSGKSQEPRQHEGSSSDPPAAVAAPQEVSGGIDDSAGFTTSI